MLDTKNLDEVTEYIKKERDEKFGTIAAGIVKFREYASGKHPNTLTAKQRNFLGDEILVNNPNDNVCDQIIIEALGRVSLKDITCANTEVSAFIKSFIKKTNLPASHAEIVYNTLRDGNSAIGLKWDEIRKRVTWTLMSWWDGSSGVFCFYDDSGTLFMAVNEFALNSTTTRRVIMFEDNYISMDSEDKNTWSPATSENGEEVKGVWKKSPAVDSTGEEMPLHVPIVHFKNLSRGIYTNYGVSELINALGLQDLINSGHLGMVANQRAAAFRMHWGTGVTPAKSLTKVSETGARPDEDDHVDLEPTPGKFFFAGNDQAKFGSFEQSESEPILVPLKFQLQRLGQVTQTPIHYITGGDWPSGDALIRAEMPAVDKARNQIEIFKARIEELIHRAIEITNAYNDQGILLDESIETAAIEANYHDPEKRDILSLSSVVKNMDGKISVKDSLLLIGFTEDQADRTVKAMEAEMIDTANRTAKLPGATNDTLPQVKTDATTQNPTPTPKS